MLGNALGMMFNPAGHAASMAGPGQVVTHESYAQKSGNAFCGK